VESETGFLVDPDDSVMLADRVEQLLKNPEAAQRMGRAGRRHVVSNFNGRTYTARLIEKYVARTI
jgi:glycosyltransferase involved in cell wall biosynthesis